MAGKSRVLTWGISVLFVLCNLSLAAAEERLITIAGVGDIMLGTDYPHHDVPPNDALDLMKAVHPVLQAADLTFGNLEGTILDGGQSSKGGCKNCYAFRMPERLAGALPAAGFDVLSIANNHARDFGTEGLNNTQRILAEMGIEYAGTTSRPAVTFTHQGVRYGFAAFAPNRGMADLRDIPAAKTIVKQLAKDSDIVIVSFHGGAEGSKHQHLTRKTETYYGENRGNVHAFSHAVIDAGADIVFGHGPHVTRAVEVYQNRFIAYSLGNFCTYGPFNLRGVNGVAPIITVHVKPDGEFVKAKVTSIRQEKRGRVLIDTEDKALKLLQTLTKADLPELNLRIDNQGWITQH